MSILLCYIILMRSNNNKLQNNSNNCEIKGNNNTVTQNIIDIDKLLEAVQLSTSEKIEDQKKIIECKDEIIENSKEKLEAAKQRIIELEQSLNNQNELIMNLDNIYANNNSLNISERYVSALNKFNNGDFNSALKLIDDELISQSESEIAESIVLKANIYQLKSDFKLAEMYFLKAIASYPCWFTYINIINFYHYINDFKNCKYYLLKCLKLSLSSYEKIYTVHKLACVYERLNDFTRSRSKFSLAIEMLRRENNPSSYMLLENISVNTNYGLLLYRENKYKESVIYCKKAIEILNNHNIKMSESEHSNMVVIYNNIGLAEYKLENYEEAETQFLHALEILDENKYSLKTDKAMIQTNLAILYMDQNMYQEAQQNLDLSFDIYNEAVKLNPSTFLPAIAEVYHSYASLYKKRNDISISDSYYLKSLKVYNDLSINYSETYTRRLLGILNDQVVALGSRATKFAKNNEFIMAENLSSKIIDLLNLDSISQVKEVIISKVKYLDFLANTQCENNKRKIAESNYIESLRLFDSLSLETQEDYIDLIKVVKKDMSIMYHELSMGLS